MSELLDLPSEVMSMVLEEAGLDEIHDRDLGTRNTTKTVGVVKALRATCRRLRNEVDSFTERRTNLSITSLESFIRLVRIHDTFSRHCGGMTLDLEQLEYAAVLGDGMKPADRWFHHYSEYQMMNYDVVLINARGDHSCNEKCVCRRLFHRRKTYRASRFAAFLNLRRLDIIIRNCPRKAPARIRFNADMPRIMNRLCTPDIPLHLKRIRFGSIETDEDKEPRKWKSWRGNMLGPRHAISWPMPPEPKTEDEHAFRAVEGAEEMKKLVKELVFETVNPD